MDIVLSFMMFEFFIILATVLIGTLSEGHDSFLKIYCLIHGFVSIVVEFLAFGYYFCSYLIFLS